ncbi:MAG TPA: dephospho-CoA kinase [Polyangiaceae bacterium]
MGVAVGFVLFGLTGGLASGKSAVASRFRERGLPIFDADDIARDVVALGTDGLAEIARAFGAELLLPDGSLDRKKMAGRVFADPAARKTLEAITHPRIAAESQARAAMLESRGEPLACYEATLLVERGLADAFRPLVVVAAREATQVERAVARGGVSADEALARIRAQLPIGDKEAVADYVIRNDGDRARLDVEADRVLDAICRSRGVEPGRYPRAGTGARK